MPVYPGALRIAGDTARTFYKVAVGMSLRTQRVVLREPILKLAAYFGSVFLHTA